MATDLQRRKLEKVFDSFDVDRDGVIDAVDITAMAQIWCETYEVPTATPAWRKIHDQAALMWRDMRLSSGTEQLTRDGWVAWSELPGFAEFVEQSAIPFSIAVFDTADADNDGKITVHEMMAAQSKSGMSEQETRAAFAMLDTDNDGYVTSAEYVQAARDFYLSDDPTAPGNAIAGDL